MDKIGIGLIGARFAADLLAHETAEVIYAPYVSAEEGRRVEMKR